jgi:hypothetical protein
MRMISFAGLWLVMFTISLLLISTFAGLFLGGGNSGPDLSSLDWAGYVVASDFNNPQPVVTSVSGSWVVPEINGSSQDRFSAAWVGIGGQSDRTLIQTGTEHDSVDGQKVYYAWYELLPDYSVTIPDIDVSAGDKITASISLVDSGSNEWLIFLSDVTTGQNFSKNFFYGSSRLSAEWIVERPTVNNTIGTLAYFDSVTFTDLQVAVNNVVGPVSNFAFQRVIMYNRQNLQLVTVSAFSAKQLSFTVTYLNAGS